MTEPVTDSFGRVHDYLRISLTERCNLRCFYCMPTEGIMLRPKEVYMSSDEVVKLATEFADLGIKKIRLTGGEPLVRKDAADIIERLSKLPIELAITTNGILVDQYMDVFRACGVKNINVSLDSLDPVKLASITRRDYSERILSNISTLVKEGFHVKLNAVIIRGVNDDEVNDFVEWTKDKPVHFRFIEFMPFDGNSWDRSKCVSYNELMNTITNRFEAQLNRRVIKIADRKNDTARNYRIEGYEGTFAVISSVTNPFCDTCNRIRLTADGKIKNCLFSNSETDLLSALRQGMPVAPLIRKAVLNKKAWRGGMNTVEDLANPLLHSNNRTMVAIGG